MGAAAAPSLAPTLLQGTYRAYLAALTGLRRARCHIWMDAQRFDALQLSVAVWGQPLR